MRFIPTSAVAVEKLKQQAKKTKQKHKVTHTEALDRVARGAGYNHWHHVTQCAAETQRRETDRPSLARECQAMIDATLQGRGKLVITGPEIINRPLILFSDGRGDAWLLEPNEGLAMPLCWQNTPCGPHLQDHGDSLEVRWNGSFSLAGYAFVADIQDEVVGRRAIHGYDIDTLREAMWQVESFSRRLDEVFLNRDTVPLTDELIDELASKGMPREDLLFARDAGAQYSPTRGSLLFPAEAG